MTDQGKGGSSGCEPRVNCSGHEGVATVDAPPCDPTRRSVERAQLSPAVLPDIKVEMVKMEDVEHDEDSEPDQYSQQEGQECHRALTEDDVALEKIFKNEVIDSKSNLGFVSEQGSCVCDVCSKVFVDEDALYDHVYHECGKEQEMNCTLCSFRTEFIDDMQSHMMLKHKDSRDPNTECENLRNRDRCDDTFDTLNVKRSKNSEGIKKYKCPICSYETNWNSHMKRHLDYVHHKEAIDPVTCPGCGKTYKNKYSLGNHTKRCSKLDNEVMKRKCKFCDFVAKWKKDLEAHIKWVHPVETIDRVVCTGCGKSYKTQHGLNQHLRICEESNQKIVKFKCFFCSHETKWKRHLSEHIRRVHPIDGMDFATCTRCSKSFDSKSSLRKHLKYCTELRFECKFCGHKTTRSYYLRKHMESQHPIGPTDRPVCTGCGKSYKHQDRLKQHQRFCEKSNDKFVKFKCFYCNHQTTRKCYLKEHIRHKHPVEAINRVPCPKCGKSLKNKDNLRNHMKHCAQWNAEIMELKCTMCSFETLGVFNLRKHIEAVHSAGEQDMEMETGWFGSA